MARKEDRLTQRRKAAKRGRARQRAFNKLRRRLKAAFAAGHILLASLRLCVRLF